MPSAVEKFLKQKREQEKFKSIMSMNSIPPSPAKRYGLDNMGGYNMGIGTYTGKGPDGITQRTAPTQRRIDASGRPYIVDENEVVVIDSETLNSFGGPEAFNEFVQKNKPQQYYNGGVPTMQRYSNAGGIPPSMAENGGLAEGRTGYRQYACGGIPTKQYYNGGVPTRERFLSPEQKQMLEEVQDGIEQYQTGGTPSTRGPWDNKVNPFIKPPDIVGPNPDPVNVNAIQTGTTPNLINSKIGQGSQIGKTGPFIPFNTGGLNNQNKTINQDTIQGQITKPDQVGSLPWQTGTGSQSWTDKFKQAQKGNKVGPKITPWGKNPIKTPVLTERPPVNPYQVVDQGFQASTIPIDPNTGNPILTERPPVNPNIITDPHGVTPDQYQVVPDGQFVSSTPNIIETQQQATSGTPKGPVYNVQNLDEMMARRYLDRLGAQQESQRAGEAQRGMQAGLTDREILGREAVGDIGRREVQRDITAGLATDQAQRAQQLQAQQQAMGMQQQQIDIGKEQWQKEFEQQQQQIDIGKEQWQKTFDFAKQKYGDQEGQRIAQDIANGMTYDQIKAKYPGISEADYNSMKLAGPIGQMDWQKEQWQQQFDFQQDQWDVANQQNAFSTLMATGDYKNAAKMFKDIYGQSIDFTHLNNEQNAMKFNEGWNNMNGLIAAGTSWENALKVMQQDGTLEKLGMTEGDVKAFYQESQMMNDPMYKSMKMVDSWVANGLVTQDQADDFTAFLQWSITNPQGVTIEDGFSVYDANGNEVGFFKTQGEADKFVSDNQNLNYTTKQVQNHITTGTTGTGTTTQQGEVLDSAIEQLSIIGATNIDPSKVQQYLDENNGKLPQDITLSEWQEWDSKTGSFSNINKFLSGDLTTQLSTSDKNLLADIKNAKVAVESGNATKEQEELASKTTYNFGNWGYETTSNTTSGSESFYPGGGMGKLHKQMEYNNDIYKQKNKDKLYFNDDVKKWIDSNKGNIIEFDGNYYQINASNPIKENYVFDQKTITSGNDTYTHDYKADALVVLNLENGKTEYITFGSKGILKD